LEKFKKGNFIFFDFSYFFKAKNKIKENSIDEEET